MRIYLAGPIYGKTDAEVRGWRAAARELAPWAVFVDPADRDFRGVEVAHFRSIVEGDKADILSCDALIVNATSPTWGTAMEILFAWEQRRRVVAFCKSPSPWVRYHASALVETLEDAVAYLRHSMPAERP